MVKISTSSKKYKCPTPATANQRFLRKFGDQANNSNDPFQIQVKFFGFQLPLLNSSEILRIACKSRLNFNFYQNTK